MVENRGSRGSATRSLQFENDRVRVTEWQFAPGEAAGWHVHQCDYVMIPVTDGVVDLDDGTTVTKAEFTAGRSLFLRAGVEHDVVNRSEDELIFVEVELVDNAGNAGERAP
jgi:beta-alanine degradation protein BauB